jgi:hypothetical protein
MSLFAPATWRLTWKKTASALDALLGPSALPVAVVGAPALGELLGERRPVVELDGAGPASVSALVLIDPEPGTPLPLEALAPGGKVVLLGRAAPTALSRLALCAGLVDLESHDVAGRPGVFGRLWKVRAPSP